MTSNLNKNGRNLVASLARIHKKDVSEETLSSHAQKVNVVGAGGSLTAAYEQLRNAAENTEEHLLLQNAIKRFYKQLFITRDAQLVSTSGNELAVELTLAGYLPNNSLSKDQLNEVSKKAKKFYEATETLQKRRGVGPEQISHWILDVLAVEVELVLNNHDEDSAFVEFAYEYFSQTLSEKILFGKTNISDFGAALYVSIYRALLKADDAAVRAMLLRRYQVSINDLDRYIEFNKNIDKLFVSKTTDRLFHIVDRQGAPLRILRRMIQDNPAIETVIEKREVFLDEYERQINKEYSQVGHRINRAIVRSVIFLIITKFIVGVAIEVPYDLWAHDKILWQPLLINLLFPPLYMVLLRLTHALPSSANTEALVDQIDTMLYGDRTSLMKAQAGGERYSNVFSFIYLLSSLAVFALVSWCLYLLDFSVVHILIFFVFISAASFLGFRLSRLIRELEVLRGSQNGVTFVRDLLYLPFVVVGRWMSDKYSRVNIVTLILDMLIELPLKTILRLVRQWAAFIDDRKDKI